MDALVQCSDVGNRDMFNTNTDMLEANMFIACKEIICLARLYVLFVSAGFGIHVLERFLNLKNLSKYKGLLFALCC